MPPLNRITACLMAVAVSNTHVNFGGHIVFPAP
jgi:hypothetical protein